MKRLLLFPLAVAAASASLACGGCPWTTTSGVAIAPATPCLDLHLADSSGTPPSTGCVDPVLVGKNNCTEPLHLPAGSANAGLGVDVAAGGDVRFEVSLDTGIRTGGSGQSHYAFTLTATLGSNPVVITFAADH